MAAPAPSSLLHLTAPPGCSFGWHAEKEQWSLREGGGGQGAIPLRPLPFVIGRAADCNLRLPHSAQLVKTTSRWHCYLSREGARCAVIDGSLREVPELGARKPSVSGTLVNGKAVQGSKELRPGDQVAIGPWLFAVAEREDISLDMDPVLKTMTEQASRRIRSDDPRVPQGFARLPGLFERLGRARDPEEALQEILAFAVQRVPGAAVAALLERASDGSMSVRMAWHRDAGRVFDLRFSAGLVRGLPADRAVLLVPRITDPSRSQLQEGITSGLIVPLEGGPEPFGFLYMDNRGRGDPFAEEDLYLAHALGSVAALQVALERNSLLARVERNMSQYFGQDVVRLILEESEKGRPVSLGLREVEATILFADMQGFSAFCRDRGPERLSELLNPYYQLCAEAMQAHGGHVDKFLGDGVLAAFGTQPVRVQAANHAVQAVQAARAILAAWGRRTQSRGDRPIPLRFGIDTGRVLVGNLGFAGRMEYTVVGDAVNLAARLEKLARPDGLAMTDATRKLLGDRFAPVDAGLEEVHGCGTVRVWRL